MDDAGRNVLPCIASGRTMLNCTSITCYSAAFLLEHRHDRKSAAVISKINHISGARRIEHTQAARKASGCRVNHRWMKKMGRTPKRGGRRIKRRGRNAECHRADRNEQHRRARLWREIEQQNRRNFSTPMQAAANARRARERAIAYKDAKRRRGVRWWHTMLTMLA